MRVLAQTSPSPRMYRLSFTGSSYFLQHWPEWQQAAFGQQLVFGAANTLAPKITMARVKVLIMVFIVISYCWLTT
jgi:hypothetical protein